MLWRVTVRIVVGLKARLGKKYRKAMKNMPKRGKSARHGNRPAPYTKYNKVPYQYPAWIRNREPIPLRLVVDNKLEEYQPVYEKKRKATR